MNKKYSYCEGNYIYPYVFDLKSLNVAWKVLLIKLIHVSMVMFMSL